MDGGCWDVSVVTLIKKLGGGSLEMGRGQTSAMGAFFPRPNGDPSMKVWPGASTYKYEEMDVTDARVGIVLYIVLYLGT
jgi:hypothetical protein